MWMGSTQVSKQAYEDQRTAFQECPPILLQSRVSPVVSLATLHYRTGLSASLLLRPVLLSPWRSTGITGFNCIQLSKCKCRVKIKLRSSGLHSKHLYLPSLLLLFVFNDNLKSALFFINQNKNIFPGNQIIKTTKEVTTSKGPHACTHRG